MKTKHTKDWKIYQVSQLGVDLKSTFLIKAGECEIIVNKPLTKSRATQKEAEANAKLIAAAPDMLEALQGMIGILTPKQREKQFPNIYNKAIAAIKKATE